MEDGQLLYGKYKEVLDDCFLINKLDPQSTVDLLNHFHEEVWPKHTCILNNEKLKFHFYIIISGRMKMYQIKENSGKEVTLFLLSKGDIFDIYCFLDGFDHTIYYECLDRVKVLAVPMEEFKNWLNLNPRCFQYILPYVGKQLRLLENFISDITFTDISTRLLKLLINNAQANNRLHLIHDLSNKEIANLLGSTGAVINRHLQKLKRNGCIKTSRNRVEILDLKVLLHLLEKENKKL